jgi:hypothetical protein
MPSVCDRYRNPSGEAILSAVRELPSPLPDVLQVLMRKRDCHFTPAVLDEAARLRARAMKSHLDGRQCQIVPGP